MDEPFGEILTLGLFSRTAAVDSPLGCKAQLVTVLSTDDGARYGFHLVDQALNPTRKSFGCFHDVHDAVAPVGTSC